MLACCICNAPFHTSAQLSKHQAECIRQVPFAELGARLYKRLVPAPQTPLSINASAPASTPLATPTSPRNVPRATPETSSPSPFRELDIDDGSTAAEGRPVLPNFRSRAEMKKSSAARPEAPQMENLQSLHSAEVKRDAASQKSRNDGAPKATDKVYEGYKVHSGLDRLRSDMEESLPQGSSPRAASRRSRIDGAPKATDKAYEEYKVHLGLDRLRSDMEESFPPGSSPRSTESPRRDLSQPKSGLAKLPSQTTASPARTPGFSPLASEQTIFPACDGCNQAFLTKESLDLHLLVCTRHGKRIVVKESARERRSAKRLLGKRRKENDLGEKRKDTPAQISMDAVPVAPAMNSTLLPISLGDLERRKEEPSSKQRLVSSPKEMTSPKHRSFSSPKRKTTPMEKVHPRLDPEAMGFLPGHMSKRFIPKNDSPAEDPDFTRPINTGSDGISHFQSVAPGVDLYNPKTQMGYSPTSMFAGPSPTLPNPMIPMGKGSVRKFRTRTASSNDGASAPGVVDGEPVSGDPLSAKQILTHIHSADSDRSKVLRNIGLIPLPTFHYQENDWVSVPERYRPTILDILKEIVHPKHELDANGFTLGPWTEDYIKGMQKCFHCRNSDEFPSCEVHPGKAQKIYNHQTKKLEQYFTCCTSASSTKGKNRIPGCTIRASHSFENFHALAANWAFEMSPDPEEDLSLPKRKAIVIDCEMGGSSFGRSELIQLSAIDFFTGDVLINKLVKPSVPIIDWRTKYSGVTEGKMRKAIMDGTSLEGWYSARTALFQFIDTDTILMGHSVNYDLEQLRLIHDQVIDAHILIPRLNGHKHGVAGLSAELCGKQVQKGGSKGHDCLEDSLAARELIIWALKNGETFIARSKLSSIQEAQRKEEARQREEARQLKALEKAEAQRIQDTEGSGEINHEEEKQHQVQSGGMGVAGLRR